ncbi:MAG TPA: hypothetical protein VFI47_16020, partial [Acidimicrobiales bacterium]|nr:hypothetical protein [Acidimicrobiales bacterium]
LVALTPGLDEPDGVPAGYETVVDGFVTLAGPIGDLAQWEDWIEAQFPDPGNIFRVALISGLRGMLGCPVTGTCDPQRYVDASPLTYVGAGVPAYIVCEVSDPFVPCSQLQPFAQALPQTTAYEVVDEFDGDPATNPDVDPEPHRPDYQLNYEKLNQFLDAATAP